jgi:hypothetical protein
MSDIGKSYGGRELTLEVYLQVEAAYLAAVRLLADEARVDSLTICGLEWHSKGGPPAYTEGQSVSIDEGQEIVRQMLREGPVWCKLEDDERFYVHVGYDYYMYVGADRVSDVTINSIRELGLYPEDDWPSPYLNEPQP